MAYLLIISGEGAGTSFHLKYNQLIGGREANRDIQILDPKVSRRHFKIERVAQNFVISELDAKNGVFVNGQQITQANLADQDVIRVGDTEFLFVASDDAAKVDSIMRSRRFSAASQSPTVAVEHLLKPLQQPKTGG